VSNHIAHCDTDFIFSCFRELEKIEVIAAGFIAVNAFPGDI
jgi:hypothetical protein